MKNITIQFQNVDGTTQVEKSIELNDGDKLIFKANKQISARQISEYMESVSKRFENADILFVPEFIDISVLKVGEMK